MQFSLLQSRFRLSSSFLANHEPKLSTTSSSVSLPLKMMKTKTLKSSGSGHLMVLRVKAYNSSSDSSAESNSTRPKSRRDILLEYVQNVKPEFMEMFVKRAPKHVVDAMRQTVTNMIGTLPPQFFAVTVTSVAENLAQLMMSVLMTGYMFRNAQYRLELQQSLEQVALPEPRDQKVPYGAKENLLGASIPKPIMELAPSASRAISVSKRIIYLLKVEPNGGLTLVGLSSNLDTK